MITKEQYLEIHNRLLSLAKSHKVEYKDQWFELDDEEPYFTYFKCNIPLLADVRMMAEEYGLRDCVDSSDSWEYVAMDFTMHRFADEEEIDEFRKMVKELSKERK